MGFMVIGEGVSRFRSTSSADVSMWSMMCWPAGYMVIDAGCGDAWRTLLVEEQTTNAAIIGPDGRPALSRM